MLRSGGGKDNTDAWFAHGPTRRYRRPAHGIGVRPPGSTRRTAMLNGLVDIERGIISREIFVNEEIYRQEQEQVFARAWLFIGHQSQVPNPGDFFVSSMGEESVIL